MSCEGSCHGNVKGYRTCVGHTGLTRETWEDTQGHEEDTQGTWREGNSHRNMEVSGGH